jgi:hypothetical protein
MFGKQIGMMYRVARFEDLNDRIGIKETDIIRPWLVGFVDSVGPVEAKKLLAGVGELEPLPDQGTIDTGTSGSSNNKTKPNAYEVGDVIHANFAGNDEEWNWAEVTAVHSIPGSYSVIYPMDCSEEIGTFDERLRLAGDLPVYNEEDYPEYRQLAKKE